MLSQFENVPSQSVRQEEFAKIGKVKFESQTFKFKVKTDRGLAQYSLPFLDHLSIALKPSLGVA